MKHIYTNRSGAKCRLDIYRWGAGLAVTERMYDIGQNVFSLLSKQEAVAVKLLPYVVTYRFPQGRLY